MAEFEPAPPAATPVASVFPIGPRLRHDPAQRRLFGTPAEMPCPLCGASVLFPPRTQLLDCPSCKAPLVRGPDDPTPLAPTGMLRFTIDPEAVPALAQAGVRRWGAARPVGAVLTTFERVYVPMWRFTAHVVRSWVSINRDEVGSAARTTGEFAEDYDQQVVASTEISHPLLELLEDVSLAGAVPFTPAGLDNARPLPVTVSVQDAWLKARVFFDKNALAGNEGLDYTVTPDWSREEGALILVPAYVGREETRSVSCPVLVDGVTGKVYGGIGNAPFDGPPPGRIFMTIAWTLLLSIVAAAVWGVLRIIGWLIGW